MRSYVRYRAASISYLQRGKGKTVVLLHGFLGSAEIWKEQIEDLSRSYRVVAIDLPGHGHSDCLGYAHSMELMANAVKAVLDHLKLKRYVVIGHSMGGYVGLAFAERYPDNLRGLCLFHSTGYPDSAERKKERSRAVELVRQNRKLYTQSTIKGLFAQKNLKYLKKEVAFSNRIASSTSRQGMAAGLLGMRDRPSRDIVLGLVRYPILMVLGEHDKLLPPGQLLEQSKQLSNGETLYLEHDAHMGFLESPKVVNKALRRFLRRCYS